MKFEILNVRNLVQPAPLEALPELQIQNQTRGNIYVQKNDQSAMQEKICSLDLTFT